MVSHQTRLEQIHELLEELSDSESRIIQGYNMYADNPETTDVKIEIALIHEDGD